MPPLPSETNTECSREELERMLDRLARKMAPAQVQRWLRRPNSAFEGSTPLQVMERGEFDRIWRMLYDLESGQAG
jgi:hypothetical protein